MIADDRQAGINSRGDDGVFIELRRENQEPDFLATSFLCSSSSFCSLNQVMQEQSLTHPNVILVVERRFFVV